MKYRSQLKKYPASNNQLTWWETDERMDSQIAADFCDLTLGSFYVARSSGRLKVAKYPWGGKDYYKKSDLLKAIESRRVDPE